MSSSPAAVAPGRTKGPARSARPRRWTTGSSATARQWSISSTTTLRECKPPLPPDCPAGKAVVTAGNRNVKALQTAYARWHAATAGRNGKVIEYYEHLRHGRSSGAPQCVDQVRLRLSVSRES